MADPDFSKMSDDELKAFIASAQGAPAAAPTPDLPAVGPYDFGQRVSGRSFRNAPAHLTETPGFGQSDLGGKNYADTQPEVQTRQVQNYALPAESKIPDFSKMNDADLKAFIAQASMTDRDKLRAEGRQRVLQEKPDEPDYVDVPVYGPDGAETGLTERVEKKRTGAFGAGVMSTLPFGEDIGAFTRSLSSGRTMAEEKDIGEGVKQALKERDPYTYRTGQVGGFLPSLALPMGLAGRAAGFVGKTALGALEGAGYGGVMGFGEGNTLEERMAHAKRGATVGGVLGGALGRFAGETAPAAAPQVSDAVAAAERLGVELPRYATTENTILQGMTPISGAVLGARGPIIAAREKATKQLGDAVDALVPRSASVEQAGQSINEGLQNWITVQSKKDADAAYGEVRGLFENPDALTPLENTRDTIAKIMAERGEAALGSTPAIDTLLPAVQKNSGVTFDGAKTLYTELRNLRSENLIKGVNDANVERLYSALKQDVMNAAENAGGEPARFFLQKADAAYAKDMAVKEQLQKLVGAKGDKADEAVFNGLFNAAKNGGSANNKLVQQAITIMGPEQLKMFQAGILSKIGRDVDGAFSPNKWLGNQGINSLSDRAKAMIFKDEPELLKALEDVTAVSQRFKNLDKYGNPSGTSQVSAGVGMLGGLWLEPISVLTTLAGGNAFSRIMSKPDTAKSAADWARRYETYVRNPTYVTGRNVYRAGVTLNQVLSSEAGKPVDVNARLNIQPPKPNP